MLRIRVRTVTPYLQGYFSCRIAIKPLSPTGEIRYYSYVALKPFGILLKIVTNSCCKNQFLYFDLQNLFFGFEKKIDSIKKILVNKFIFFIKIKCY